MTDVTGDKKILKKIKKAGEGTDRPNEGSQVKGNLHLKKIILLSIYANVNAFLIFTKEVEGWIT